MNTQTQLKDLYQQYWPSYLTNIKDACSEPAAFPFLIEPEQSYLEAESRIMICGQETCCWGEKEYGKQTAPVTVPQMLEVYRRFVWDGGYNSPYWNFVNRIKIVHPEKGFVINNIVKIGRRYESGCSDEINDKALQYFPVFRQELQILKPDMIVFLTGPKYDWRIQKVLGPFRKEPVREGSSCLDLISFEDKSLPQAIRCYHPGYLRRNKLTDVYLKDIIDFCK